LQKFSRKSNTNLQTHFKAIIAGVDDNFPMKLWDRLLPQAVLTLILLRQSNIAPTVSAYQYTHGTFDYKRMLMAPMGCEEQIHKRSEKRGSRAANLVDGWYLCTSPEHY
jgi:hypothetical protein